MFLLLLGKPFVLVIAYGVLGALFMPFLALTLLPLLNSKRVPKQWRNKWYTNLALVITAALFTYLGAYQLYDVIAGILA